MKRAFTLVELLVVLGIMVLLMAITIAPIKSMSRNNSQKQAVNQLTALIAHARSTALQRGRVYGVVFFEDTTKGQAQTSAQFIREDPNQAQYAPTINKIFIEDSSERQHFPRGVRLAAISDNPARQLVTGDATAAEARSRVVLFDSKGQLILHSGIAAPTTANYADWKLAAPADYDTDPSTGESIPSLKGQSTPGFVVFNKTEYDSKGFTNSTTDQDAAASWLKQNGDLVVINAYTGNVIR